LPSWIRTTIVSGISRDSHNAFTKLIPPILGFDSQPRISDYVSSRDGFWRANPTEPDYAQALHLGKLLGQAGCTVLTGGYIGTMEAVSRGAAENGGHVIGVTCEEIETWRKVRVNRWVKKSDAFQLCASASMP